MSRVAAVPKRKPSGEVLTGAFAGVREELLGTLWFLLGSYDDAQDAAQETFLKCWRARARLSRVRNLRAWIFRVGLNAAKDLQRNAWRRRVRPLEMALPPVLPPATSPAELVVHDESLGRLRDALVALRPEEKEVFLLRQNGDLTYEQIAALHRRPVGTVKTQMRSALQKLRKVLQEHPVTA
jgi:RNA polymerase sigma-70 factor (ECF subfamily)